MKNFVQKICNLYNYNIYYQLVVKHKFPKIYNYISSTYTVKNIESTAMALANSNKSMGRFGDGEIEWILNVNNKNNEFENPSNKLRTYLINVLQSNDHDFMIGLPDAFYSFDKFTSSLSAFWKVFLTRYAPKFLKFLDKDKVYYDTSVSRPYTNYNSRKIASEDFSILKDVWNKKNILIVEGIKSRVGVNNDLFSNANIIKRIECPPTHAFEYYKEILNCVLNNLKRYGDYLVLISLGPTATVLSYDICKHGYRAIDIGHLDFEYDWYLMGAKEKVNIPYKYINKAEGVKYGNKVSKLYDCKYYKEIIDRIA